MSLEKREEFSQNSLRLESALSNFSHILSDIILTRITSDSDNPEFADRFMQF